MKVKVINIRDLKNIPKGSIAINTTSRSKNWSRGLSPFILGPCKLYGGFEAQNVENAWQYAKVYKKHTDNNGNPTSHYWGWAANGWHSKWANRYPMGKGAVPEYSYWDGERLDYIEARMEIYVPVYRKAARKSTAFMKLRKLATNSDTIYLYDFDSYDNEALGMSLIDARECEERKFGHSFVLAMMLNHYGGKQ